MTKIVYDLEKKSVSDHQLRVASVECCRAMIPVSYTRIEDSLRMTADVSGLFHLKTFLIARTVAQERSNSSLSMFKEILDCLRRVVEAVDLAEEFFIPFGSVGLELEFLYFKTRDGKAMFLLMPSEKDFIESLQALCMEIFSIEPRSNADVIAERLLSRNAEELLDRKGILRLLSSWACELA